MRALLAPALAALVVLSALARPGGAAAQSQTTSAIRGTVTNAEGLPVADASVQVRHTLTGAERVAVTDAQGHFLVLLLQPGGPYSLRVARIGYAQGVEEGIQLQVGETRTVSLQLRVQAVEVEGVSVSVDRSAIFNPAQAGPATLLNERALESVPILSRDVMELAVLSPLVRTTESGGFSIGGQNDRYNAILVDGLLNQDAFGLTAGGVPGGQAGAKLLPIDAVAQYEILVAPYDARLSGFAGGVMNAVTKTGTNDWRVRTFAVGRHEALMGDLTLPSGTAEASGVQRTLAGLSVGGPLVRDKAHVFLSTELERRRQPPSGYNLGRDLPALVGLSPDVMQLFQARFEADHGVATGEAGPYALDQSLANVFARLDWELGGGRRLTARNVFAYASNDESPNRSPFEPYELSSNAVLRTSASNATSVQLFTDLGSRGGNELDFTVQRTTDRTDPAADFPQVEVVLRSPDEAITATRPVRLGAHFYAQQNDLAQTSARLTNTLTLARGRSTWTVGAAAAWYDIRQEYLPGAMGDYAFVSWPDVLDNAPQRYQRTALLDGQSPAIGFNVAELSAFAQDQIEIGNLTLRFGLRADVPFVLDRPAENSRVLAFFERSTSSVPSGRPLLSPRIGFNWHRGDGLRTQVRGGAGLFTGQLPYVWLANAFHNTGMRSVVQSCYGRWTDDPATGNTAPPFDPSAPDPTCLRGPPRETRVVTLFEDGFAYPQYAKISAAVDQEITPRLSASVGVIFSHSVNQVLLRELNIHPQDKALGPLRGYGGTARTYFGTPSDAGFSPIRLLPGHEQVLLVTNGGGDRSWSASAELRGSLGERLAFQAGYAYARSYDRMSLASVDLIADFGQTPTHGDPNDPPLTPSNFDRPHKVVLALYGAPIPGLESTEISLLYTGESGLPFSYVYRGDYNGDGYPGQGPAFDRNNDLMYVPLEPFEVPSGFGTSARLKAALETDACLREFRGAIMLRNHCRAPWQNRLDVRLAHATRIRGAAVRLEADMVNVLNLLDSDWGLVNSIGATSSLLEPFQRVPITGELLSDWAGGILPFRNQAGELVTPEPWTVSSPVSQWQAQLGVRITLGG
ncbi:MAG: carboxypeptidase regulatory-like domain-containing protein [Longimicrobiales bacterium]|nr:carboxypeptidase regulatory-like domain-containing protein [Longimicrobiales bacterium]